MSDRNPCDRAAERLPFLLNGTLDGEEREVLQRHLGECEACRDDLRRARLVWRLHDAHPETQPLVDYVFGEIDEDERTAVEGHLAVCPSCREERDLLVESRDRAPAGRSVVPLPARAVSHRPPAPWRRLALAAAWVAAVGFGAWVWLGSRAELSELRDRVAELSGPSLNVATVEVFADGDAVRSAVGVEPVPVPNRSSAVHLLVIPPEEVARTTDARVRLLDASGREVWRGDGLRRQATGEYSIHLPPATLPEGLVTIVFEEAGRGDWVPVARLDLDVTE